MIITNLTKDSIAQVVELWNSCLEGLYYKPFTIEGFEQKFLQNPNFSYNYSYICIEGNNIIGFINGVCKKDFLPGETNENTSGYLTMIMVHNDYRREGIGSKLLRALETAFKKAGKKTSEAIFFNPINLEWYIPETNGHDHPNAPGVLKDSAGHKFLLKHGYTIRAEQNSFYMTLDKLMVSDKVNLCLENLTKKKIVIEYYNEEKHHSLNELFDDFNNELWRKEIISNVNEHKERPVIIVSDNNEVSGFTGPLYVQPSGRGYFTGIGVKSSHSGMGIGTALFYKLCEGLRDEGAVFMSLFTGVTNPARKMYEGTGFQVVASWVNLKKEI